MRYVLAILLILSVVNSSIGQVRLSGCIRDVESGEALSGVMVSAYKGTEVLAYSFSNNDGNYELTLKDKPAQSVYYLMGYRKVSRDIYGISSNDIRLDISLESYDIGLPEITVKPVPVTISGDTVTYDASKFVRNEDNSLQEVLNRLPHIQATAMGTIKVQGVNVNKVYIEDMDLLGGRYGIAIKNIHPDDIASVSVYYNHQPIKVLQGKESTGQAAINIKLKEKVKNKWNLNGSAQAGLPKWIYGGKIGALSFGGKMQTIAIAKSDHSGEDIITETKMQNLKPGAYLLEDIKGEVSDLFSFGIHTIPVASGYYMNNFSNVISVNNIVKLANGATLRSNVVASSDIVKSSTVSSTTVFPDNEKNRINITDNTYRKRDNKRIEGEFTYTGNKESLYLENEFSFKIMADEADVRLNSLSSGYQQQYSLPKLLLGNRLEIVKRKSGKIRTIVADFAFSHINQSMAVEQDMESDLFGTNYIVQSLFTENVMANLNTSYRWNTGKVFVSIIPGTKIWYKEYKTSVVPEIDSMYNDINLTSIQPYLNGRAEFNGSKFKIKLDIPLSMRLDFSSGINRVYPLFSPLLNLEYQLLSSVKINGQGNIYNRVGDINEMGNGYIYASYRNLYSYEVLPEYLNQMYSLSASYDNFSKFVFLKFYANYNKIHSNYLPDELFLDDYTFISYREEDNLHRMFTAGFSIKKIFGNTLNAGALFDLSKNRQIQYLQGEKYDYETQGYGISLNMEFTPFQNISIKYSGSYRAMVLDDGSSTVLKSLSNRVEASWQLFGKVLLRGNYFNWYQVSGDNDIVSLPFLDVELKYDINSKVQLFSKFKNLFDTKEYSNTRFSSAHIISQKAQLRGRELLIGVSLKM